MQNSSGKSIKKYTEVIILIALLMGISSCTSVKNRYKAVPYGALPGDCLFYFALSPEILPQDVNEGSLKAILKRTDEITGGVKNGEYYLLFKGKYPDAFAEKRISESPGWKKGDFKKCYYNESSNISLYFAKNNHIFVSNYINNETGDKPLELIYNNYRAIIPSDIPDTDMLFDSQGYFTSRDKDNLFQIYSGNASDLISMIPEINFETSDLINLELLLKNTEIDENSFSLESSIVFSTDKEASRFSPVIKLVLIDKIRKENSGITAANGRRFSVKKDNNIIKVSDILISDKVTDDLFNKILKGQVF